MKKILIALVVLLVVIAILALVFPWFLYLLLHGHLASGWREGLF
ncbi:MAG: hypothetical protein ACREGR_03375 [Minisyncoccia bacterium]